MREFELSADQTDRESVTVPPVKVANEWADARGEPAASSMREFIVALNPRPFATFKVKS